MIILASSTLTTSRTPTPRAALTFSLNHHMESCFQYVHSENNDARSKICHIWYKRRENSCKQNCSSFLEGGAEFTPSRTCVAHLISGSGVTSAREALEGMTKILIYLIGELLTYIRVATVNKGGRLSKDTGVNRSEFLFWISFFFFLNNISKAPKDVSSAEYFTRREGFWRL